MADHYFDGSYPGDPTPTPSFRLESRDGVGVGSVVDDPIETLVSPRTGSSDSLDREFEENGGTSNSIPSEREF